ASANIYVLIVAMIMRTSIAMCAMWGIHLISSIGDDGARRLLRQEAPVKPPIPHDGGSLNAPSIGYSNAEACAHVGVRKLPIGLPCFSSPVPTFYVIWLFSDRHLASGLR